MAVYKLDRFFEDPEFEGFTYNKSVKCPFFRSLPNGDWEVPQLAGLWKPTGVQGDVRPFNDFPCLMTEPAFSQRAVTALGDMLASDGELIPFESPSGSTYYAFNVTTVLDALDVESSKVIFFKGESRQALRILRHEFFPEVVANHTIFRIRQRATDVYVTDGFVKRVHEAGLQGFNLRKVWPLPRGADWRRPL